QPNTIARSSGRLLVAVGRTARPTHKTVTAPSIGVVSWAPTAFGTAPLLSGMPQQAGLRAAPLISAPLVTAAANGDGTATVSDSSISCFNAPSCNANSGDTVTLNAVANNLSESF